MTYLALCKIELESGEAVNALPCPFCAAAVDLNTMLHTTITNNGGATELEEIDTGWSVYCETCHSEGPFHPREDEAVTAWNTRYFYQDSNDAPATQ